MAATVPPVLVSSESSLGPNDATRRRLDAWHAEYGPVYRVQRPDGNTAAEWVIHEPEAVRDVLARRSRHFTKGQGLDRVKILLGNGLMVSEGDFWQRQRRLMQPAFRPQSLADFYSMIFDETRKMAEELGAAADANQPVAMVPRISELILVMVLKSVFGPDYDALVIHDDNPFRLLTAEPARDLSFARRFHILTRLVHRLLAKRCEQPAASNDFLGHLASAVSDGAMSEREAVDEVMTLIVAGHETTASALAFAWHLLATHPDVLAKAQAAADSVDEDQLRVLGDGERGQLEWLDHIVAETLRLYPPGWLLSRRALTTVDVGGYYLDAGVQVYISPYILHRDPAIWVHPTGFDPGRFERPFDRASRFAYIPFAAGMRRCIGEQLARVEMRTHLVTLLRRFTPHPMDATPPSVEAGINLRPSSDIPIQFCKR